MTRCGRFHSLSVRQHVAGVNRKPPRSAVVLSAGTASSVQPNSALSCATVAPLFAAVVAAILRALGRLHTGGRIVRDVLGLHRPFEQPAHDVEEVARLRWRVLAPLQAALRYPRHGPHQIS